MLIGFDQVHDAGACDHSRDIEHINGHRLRRIQAGSIRHLDGDGVLGFAQRAAGHAPDPLSFALVAPDAVRLSVS
jgi:hypothetical protein